MNPWPRVPHLAGTALEAAGKLLRPPLWGDLRNYRWSQARADLVAGGTVAMVSIPQAAGFALIAGLPPSMAFTCVIVGGAAAACFFSSRFLVFGPSNSLSLLLASTFLARPDSPLSMIQMAVTLAVLVGIFQLGAGLFRLGQVTQFISRSVVIGYGAAVGVLLVLSQLHLLVGLPRGADLKLIAVPLYVAKTAFVTGVHLPAVLLSVASVAFFWLIRRWCPRCPEVLLGLVFFALLSRIFDWRAQGIVTLGQGEPLLTRAPDVATASSWFFQLETWGALMGPALALALLGMLEATAIAKTYGLRSGERIDPNRELVAMGLGNLAAAAFAGMPGSASFARSAANFQAGAATRLAGLLASVTVLGLLALLAPVVSAVPVPVLAVALIRIGWRMIDRVQIKTAIASTGSDAVVAIGTFVSALVLPLDLTIFIGVGLALVLALRKASSPALVEYGFNQAEQLAELADVSGRVSPQVAIIHVEGEMFFGAADLFQDQVRQRVESENLRVVILRLKNARHLDATTVFALAGLHEFFQQTGRHLLISGVHGEVLRVLVRSGLLARLGVENIFPAELNPNLATRKALIQAQRLLGTPDAEVRIFYNNPARAQAG